MAESSEGEDEGKLVGRNQQLIVEDDLCEMGNKAAWSVSSCKPGNAVLSLRDDNVNTYWQSDSPEPHLVNIQFQKKVKLQASGNVTLQLNCFRIIWRKLADELIHIRLIDPEMPSELLVETARSTEIEYEIK